MRRAQPWREPPAVGGRGSGRGRAQSTAGLLRELRGRHLQLRRERVARGAGAARLGAAHEACHEALHGRVLLEHGERRSGLVRGRARLRGHAARRRGRNACGRRASARAALGLLRLLRLHGPGGASAGVSVFVRGRARKVDAACLISTGIGT
jgi:hypothetical protein